MPGKSQIVDRIVARGWSRQAAGSAVDAVLEEISAALAAGERVTLTGFGTFEAAPRAARNARNPRTGALVEVSATTVARFHPGVALRARVAGGSAAGGGDSDEPIQARAAGSGTAGTRAIRTGTGVTSPDESGETTKTIHRAKGADEVKVKRAGSKDKAASKKAAEKKAAEKKAAEKKAAEKKAAEKKAAAKAKDKKAQSKAKAAKGKTKSTKRAKK
ncbi:HU family DNA-binding protein [Cellulomonas rhizosphaerae]|uniref:HU family DNA-binding protein n=1 Tax=Cellulomonas rhizosphaerae TaxID=2293719 RepID=A0A413RPX2_9CELL|nr:HU family DNA-binding protein [Cellulomonas rhizosphaerae]RHA44025.1 HU family DNA-binding protein [Cellulomonas rhizosphaerae]